MPEGRGDVPESGLLARLLPDDGSHQREASRGGKAVPGACGLEQAREVCAHGHTQRGGDGRDLFVAPRRAMTRVVVNREAILANWAVGEGGGGVSATFPIKVKLYLVDRLIAPKPSRFDKFLTHLKTKYRHTKAVNSPEWI